MLARFGYKLASSFARRVIGVLGSGTGVLGDNVLLKEPGDETGEKLINVLGAFIFKDFLVFP